MGRRATVGRVGQLELWTMGFAGPRRAAGQAQRAEAEGWDGILVVDSQNLSGDPYVALAAAALATHTVRLGTGVTNPVTRHPAVTATAAASVQSLSGGRMVLGIGRGDSSLFHLGQEPAPVAAFATYLQRLQGYLTGGAVDLDGFESRNHWIAAGDLPKVPVDVAATGPQVVRAAARWADRITFAVGVNSDRLRQCIAWARDARTEAGLDPDGQSYGCWVNVVPGADLQQCRQLARGGLATFAHFSSFSGRAAAGTPDQDRTVVERLHREYDRARHTQSGASHTALLDDDFVDRWAAIGPVDHCTARLREMVDAGAERLVVIGPSADSDRDAAQRARDLTVTEVVPALRG
jgi:5,10-methylenetetrahydromethanopterin reductase